MGGHWGNIGHTRGFIHWKISPFEQKAFAGAFSQSTLQWLIRGARYNLMCTVPPFLTAYLVVNWANAEHERLQRKPALREKYDQEQAAEAAKKA